MAGIDIIVEQQPKNTSKAAEEARLQARCVVGHAAKYPERRKFLIGYFAETKSRVEGAQKQSLGLVRGVSDLMYFWGRFRGIEMKFPGSSHKVDHLKEQCEWLITVPDEGYFCDSEEMFWEIIEGGNGIDPRKVLAYLKTIKDKSITWDRELFL